MVKSKNVMVMYLSVIFLIAFANNAMGTAIWPAQSIWLEKSVSDKISIKIENGTVIGSWYYQSGQGADAFDGTVSSDGKTITGRWFSNYGDKTMGGRYSFTISADGQSFSGKVCVGEDDPLKTGSPCEATLISSSGSSNQVIDDASDNAQIFSNMNDWGVGNAPSANTQFTLSKSYMITEILTYHWNNGKGAAPGTIKLVDGNGKVYGPWSTIGLAGSGGVKNCNWQCNPNIVLPAGTYIVIDSNPATWSCNGGSGNAGFTRVFGYESNAAPVPVTRWQGQWQGSGYYIWKCNKCGYIWEPWCGLEWEWKMYMNDDTWATCSCGGKTIYQGIR